jgi:hypothetical protein
MKVITSGRTDIAKYFGMSGIRQYKELSHTPFLAFIVKGDTVTVRIVDSAPDLLKLPDDTAVMAQWGGKWKSDFFRFTVAQLRDYISKSPPKNFEIV